MADILFVASICLLKRVTFRYRLQRGTAAVEAVQGLAFLFAQEASHD